MASRIEFLGLQFDTFDESAAVREVVKLAGARTFSYVVTPNVDHVVQLHRRPPTDRLWAAYARSALCLCDSRILQALAQRDRLDLPVVPGSDLTARLLNDQADAIRSIAVVGGTAHMVDNLRRRYPKPQWNHLNPPMGVATNPAAQRQIVEFIEAERADLCFLAIGAPQSELICEMVKESGVARGVALCIGASLEFITGTKRRAPPWMQRSRLEWLFRLMVEPRRLARRYLLDGPQIFMIWVRWRRSRKRAACGSTPSAGQ